jgi:hypothetical protein
MSTLDVHALHSNITERVLTHHYLPTFFRAYPKKKNYIHINIIKKNFHIPLPIYFYQINQPTDHFFLVFFFFPKTKSEPSKYTNIIQQSKPAKSLTLCNNKQKTEFFSSQTELETTNKFKQYDSIIYCFSLHQ